MSAIAARAVRADRAVMRRDLVRVMGLLGRALISPRTERAEQLLTQAVAHLALLLQIYDSDPTLAGCPAGREASFEDAPVAVEYLLDQIGVASGSRPRRHQQRVDTDQAWALAEATIIRLADLLGPARAVARADVETKRGQQAVARAWTEAAGQELGALAGRIHELLAPALELEHVDPATKHLRQLADSLTIKAGMLVRTRHERVRGWDALIEEQQTRAHARYERARGALAEPGGTG